MLYIYFFETDFNPKDLRKAMQSAFKDLQTKSTNANGNTEDDIECPEQAETENTDSEAVQAFIEEMMTSGYSMEVAKKALLAVEDPLETGEGLITV